MGLLPAFENITGTRKITLEIFLEPISVGWQRCLSLIVAWLAFGPYWDRLLIVIRD